MRTVSTVGPGGVTEGTTPRSALPRPRRRYPPTPAATTTSPTTAGVRDLRLGGVLPRGNGVVGAPVISVGASAAARGAGGAGGRGRGALRPFAGAATGCSGQTAVANSSMIGKR